MKPNADLTKLLTKNHENKWVALSQDRQEVVESAESLEQLREKLGARKDDLVYMKVLPSDMEFAFVSA